MLITRSCCGSGTVHFGIAIATRNRAATAPGSPNAATSTRFSRRNFFTAVMLQRLEGVSSPPIPEGTVRLVPDSVQQMIDDARRDPHAFWDRAARELPWFRTWDRVFVDGAGDVVADGAEFQPAFRWFAGARTNLAHNALDHHVAQGRGGHTALIYFNERGDERRFSYDELLQEVERVAAALRALGIGKGDRVTVYMPTIPEAIALMLAVVRIGAIHSVVFAGFGARALIDRVVASGSRLLVTADVTYRKGKNVALRTIVDDALRLAPNAVEHVVVLDRGAGQPAKDRKR